MEPEIAGKNPCAYGEKDFKRLLQKNCESKTGYPTLSLQPKKEDKRTSKNIKNICVLHSSLPFVTYFFVHIGGMVKNISKKNRSFKKKHIFFGGFLSLKGRFRRSTTPHGVETTANLGSWLAIQVMLEASC